MGSAYEKILRGIKDMQAYQAGDKSRGRVWHVEVYKPDVKAIRAGLGMTQTQLADAIGVSVATLQNWEQGHRNPTGAARSLLLVMEKEPEAVMRALLTASPTKLIADSQTVRTRRTRATPRADKKKKIA